MHICFTCLQFICVYLCISFKHTAKNHVFGVHKHVLEAFFQMIEDILCKEKLGLKMHF